MNTFKRLGFNHAVDFSRIERLLKISLILDSGFVYWKFSAKRATRKGKLLVFWSQNEITILNYLKWSCSYFPSEFRFSFWVCFCVAYNLSQLISWRFAARIKTRKLIESDFSDFKFVPFVRCPRSILWEFCEENEVVIQEILASQLRTGKPQELDFVDVKLSFAMFSMETKIPTTLSQKLPCFLHLRFKQQAPSEWASDKKKGSMTVSFPKTWKFNHFLCLILSSLRKMSGTASAATPSFMKKGELVTV